MIGGGGAAARRRSNVVKEVERLEKNREERRARQAEIKEEKKALMNMDPGNPNWEFLSMIKYFRYSVNRAVEYKKKIFDFIFCTENSKQPWSSARFETTTPSKIIRLQCVYERGH
jgi:hypothetical protein